MPYASLRGHRPIGIRNGYAAEAQLMARPNNPKRMGGKRRAIGRAREDGRVAFDLFAPSAWGEFFHGSERIAGS